MAENSEKNRKRATKVGEVVSTGMKKTIVVKVNLRKSHPLYRRVINRSRKFYAHDEQNQAMVGDVVRIEETRPMSKLKRWRLLEIIRRPALVQAEAEAGNVAGKAS
jgi:small subunit ribosomal protein S17